MQTAFTLLFTCPSLLKTEAADGVGVAQVLAPFFYVCTLPNTVILMHFLGHASVTVEGLLYVIYITLGTLNSKLGLGNQVHILLFYVTAEYFKTRIEKTQTVFLTFFLIELVPVL